MEPGQRAEETRPGDGTRRNGRHLRQRRHEPLQLPRLRLLVAGHRAVGHSVYGLLGAEVPPRQIDALLAAHRSQRGRAPRAGQPRLDRRRQGLAALPALQGGQHLRGHHRAGGLEEGGPRPLHAGGPRRQPRSAPWRPRTAAPGAWGPFSASTARGSTITSSSPSTSRSARPPSPGTPWSRRYRPAPYSLQTVCRSQRAKPPASNRPRGQNMVKTPSPGPRSLPLRHEAPPEGAAG